MSESESTIFADQAPAAPEQTSTAPAPAVPAAPAVTQDPYNDLLKGITTTEGAQKYGTVSDALNSITSAQSHISTLEEENQRLREASTQSDAVDTILAKLNETSPADQPVGLDENSVMQLVSTALRANDAQKTSTTNVAQVTAAMQTAHGDKAEQVFYAKAADLGISNEFMNELAAKSPKMVLEMFKATTDTSHSLRGDVNTTAMTPAETQIPTSIPSKSKDLVAMWNAMKPNG